MRAKDAVGRYGERLAERYLAAQGLEVLDRNWRGDTGEVDLVARQGRTLVVVEVKTRRGTGYGHPAEAVTPAKLRRLRRLAGQWLHEHPGSWAEVRIDVVAVVLPRSGAAQVEHLVGVS
ncbi:YraN family protein [Isoptericola jiangsuensis]|uniref:YraN family protein n=1 Tax=Isoptericola jiangsuensis TaxID=548579 RepID=UPI003AAF5E59